MTPYDEANPKVTRLNRLLIDLVCKEALPFRVVESPSFKAFVAELDPRYKLPNRHDLSATMIPDAYKAKKEEVKLMLRKAVAVALTTDMWTSSNNDSYMGVTCHFIDNEFHANHKCLAVSHSPGSHTAEFIKDELVKMEKDWGLDGCIKHYVTDSGANVKKAMTLLTECVWRACFAHTLQLVVNGGIANKQVSYLPKLLASARSIVGHFRRSPAASQLLKEAQKQLKLPLHRLQQDCPTRWNSQVTMLERLKEQHNAVTLVLSNETTINALSAQQWVTASELIEALRPFLDITEMMSSAAYPTLSMIIPVLDGLQDLLLATTGGLDVLQAIFSAAVDTRFGDVFTDGELCAATLVDPRFKSVLFTTDARKKKAVESTLDQIVRAVSPEGVSTGSPTATAASIASSIIPTPTTPVRSAPIAPPMAPIKRGIWDKFDRVVAGSPGALQPDTLASRSRESLQRELDHYLQEPLIHRTKGNPLQWWADNRSRFPAVATLAQQLLCIPATSVPSERLFSKAGDVITKKRNSLDPLKAKKIIFLMEN